MAEEWYHANEAEAAVVIPGAPVLAEEPGPPPVIPAQGSCLVVLFKIFVLTLLGVPAGLCLFGVGWGAWEGFIPWWYALLMLSLPLAWRRKSRDLVGADFWGAVLVMAWVLGLTWLIPPNMGRPSHQGQTTACKSNLKHIATACEMYSTDYAGRYPRSLDLLTPNYLKKIPTCPAASVDTYSLTFTSASVPDLYTLYCGGLHHQKAGLARNYPQYNCLEGLVVGPK